MAVSFVAAGTTAKVASGDLSVDAPAGIAANDILLLVYFGRDSVSPTVGNGYTLKQSAGGSNRRSRVFWKRTNGTESATTVTHTAGDAALAAILAFRGCPTTGDPFDSASGGQSSASSGSVSVPTLTTASDNAYVLMVAGSVVQSTWSIAAAGDLGSTAELLDDSTALGSGASFAVEAGVMASHGAVGTLTLTQSVSGLYVAHSLALAASGGTPKPYPGGKLMTWDGAAWVQKPLYAFVDGQWQQKPLYRYESGNWYEVDTLRETTQAAVIEVTDAANLDQALVDAAAAGPGTWVHVNMATCAHTGKLYLPDYVNLKGNGIYDQGTAGGGGGTRLQCALKWGSHSTIKDVLLGTNGSSSCQHYPVPRGSSLCGDHTNVNGSHGCHFKNVRFKGGSDAGAHLIDLASNYGSGLWSGSLKTLDLYETTWDDCEFERPNWSPAVTSSPGNIMNIWLDCRAGGAQVHTLAFRRCHFGVKNGYNTGSDGYGCGRMSPFFQPAPAEHAADGPRPSSGSNLVSPGSTPDQTNGWYPSFDWDQVDHCFHDVTFEDVLFEFTTQWTANLCDYARSYSVWKGNETALPGTLTAALSASANLATGWGNPPGAQWTNIPADMWFSGIVFNRVYFKGSYPSATGVRCELASGALVTGSYCGTGTAFGNAGKFGNSMSGTFSNANRPVTAIFPAGASYDWTGVQTNYTPSPYDP